MALFGGLEGMNRNSRRDVCRGKIQKDWEIFLAWAFISKKFRRLLPFDVKGWQRDQKLE